MNDALRSSVNIRAEPATPRLCKRIIGIAEGSIIAAIISVQETRNGASPAPTSLPEDHPTPRRRTNMVRTWDTTVSGVRRTSPAVKRSSRTPSLIRRF